MAELTNTTINTAVSTSEIRKADGTPAINIDNITSGARYQRQLVMQKDLTERSFGTSWELGPTFTTLSGFKANSLLHLYYLVPMRNNSTSWGGAYIEPQIQFNQDGVWNSLGSCGYDGGVMGHENRILSYRNFMLIDPGQTQDFSIQLRFYCKTYDGTGYWNQYSNGSDGGNIELTSGTASLLNSNINDNHYMNVKIKELARLDNG